MKQQRSVCVYDDPHARCAVFPCTAGSLQEHTFLGWLGFFPACTAAYLLLVTSVNIPFEDDYDGIGEFLEHYVLLHGFGSGLRGY